jgi:hypothetical protein
VTTEGFLVTAAPDMDAIVTTLTSAFRDDPVLVWTFPREVPRREQLMDGFFRVTTELLLGHGGLAAATPRHEAVLVWSPPGTPDLSKAENTRYRSELAAAAGACGERATTLMETLDGHYPQGLPPHNHVMFAAARPSSEVTGAGVILLRAILRQQRRLGFGLYAEASSPLNLSLWEQMGMRRVGDEISLPDDGPSLYPIWMDAPSGSAA